MPCECENCKAKQRLCDIKLEINQALKSDNPSIELHGIAWWCADLLSDRDLSLIIEGREYRKRDQWLANVQPEGVA